MNAKECRQIVREAVEAMRKNPTGPAEMHVSISMMQMHAMWEIAAQLAEFNSHYSRVNGTQDIPHI